MKMEEPCFDVLRTQEQLGYVNVSGYFRDKLLLIVISLRSHSNSRSFTSYMNVIVAA